MEERKGWIWEWSQSFHVHPASECVPVSVGCSRILHAANVVSAGNCPSLFIFISHSLPSFFFLSNSHYNSSNTVPVFLILFFSLALFISLFPPLAGRLTLHWSNAVCSQSFNSLLQQSCSVKLFGSFQPAKLSLTMIPQKKSLHFLPI